MLPALFFLGAAVLAVITLSAFQRARPGAGPVLALGGFGWWALVFGLAQSGVLARFDALPPRLPLLALACVGLGLLSARLAAVKEALERMPAWWPIALQTFRAPLELGLYALFTDGLMPRQMTFSGSNLDVLVGLSAPVMAWLVATGRAGRGVQLAWQAGSIALLINVVRIAITSAPGPLHADWPGAPLTLVGEWPFALLPAFFVPVAALGHLAALWKLGRVAPSAEGSRRLTVMPIDRIAR